MCLQKIHLHNSYYQFCTIYETLWYIPWEYRYIWSIITFLVHSLDSKIKKIIVYLLLWMKNTKMESFIWRGEGELMEARGHEEVCLHTSHPAHCSMNSWTSQPCLDLIFSSLSQPHHLHSLPGTEPVCFTNQHPPSACWAQPILINLARILHLHKENQVEDRACNLSLYKACFSLFFPEHTISRCWDLGLLLQTLTTLLDEPPSWFTLHRSGSNRHHKKCVKILWKGIRLLLECENTSLSRWMDFSNLISFLWLL